MSAPQTSSSHARARRAALVAVVAGLGITGLKFALYAMTGSVAVLSDAMESIINIAAATAMLYAVGYAGRPADRDHPYGHGKVEFLAVGLEGWMILGAGLLIGYQAIHRLIQPRALERLDAGILGLAGIGVLTLALAGYVWRAGRRCASPTLIADGKHLMTDSISTWAVLIGLILVRGTGYVWLDPIVALLVAGFIVLVGRRLLWQSVHGLMDRQDPADDKLLRTLLDEEVAGGAIHGYHRLRHRHHGALHWVDLHLQIDGDLSVRQGHAVASRIERRIEEALGQAQATAHVEPAEGGHLRADDLGAG